MTMCLVGTVYGWTETSFLLLTSGIGNAPLTLTPDEYSWVVYSTVLGSMIGSLLSVQLADRIGRKYCLIACSIVFIIGWLDMHSSPSVQMLYFSRGVLGIGVGIARTINPMFVSEVADVKLRGRLGTLIAANVYPGSLLTYALGPSLTYTSHLLPLAGISAIFTLLLICLRETPYFLVAKGKKEQACKSIAYYKGIEDPDQVKVELRALRAEARYGLHQQSASDLHSQSRSDLPPPYSSIFPSASCSDLPPPYSSILPAASSSDLLPPYSSILPSTSRSDLPPLYRSNLPSQSIRETHSDPTREVVGTEATSDLNLPSSSDSHSQSISSADSKFKCEIRTVTTGELRVEYSRVSPGLPFQTSRELHSQSASDLHRPSTSQIHRPPTSQIHPDPTCEIHQASTSRIHHPPTSQIHPDPTCEIHQASTSQIHQPSTSQILPEMRSELHSQARSDLHTPTRVDSRASTDISEPYMDLTKYTCLDKLRAILQRRHRRALFIMLGLIMAQHLSGNFTATQHLRDLISRKATSIDRYNALIWIELLRVLSGYLTALIVDWCGRRKLLILSIVGTCYTSFVLSAYLYTHSHESDDSTIPLTPFIHLVLYQIMFHIGLGVLPNVFLCDLFPTKLKGIAGAIVVIFDGIIGFTTSKLNQAITDTIGAFANYTMFWTSCWMAFLITFLWVPETRGKTYHEIEALLFGENFNSLNEEVSNDEMDTRRI
ncbi:facilitated trehalose transporter Tret1-like [Bombus huntii]|uniref:facilitated trehalose transporter Tret1-like n=1 Tax=Bombus huntii TaxID=85661 RepID=UPI0021A980CA|nr:facilitated trehalose transporter Tret1-like [Bombus huntii]